MKPYQLILVMALLSSCAKPLISNLEKGRYKYDTAPANILQVAVSVLPADKAAAAAPDKPKTFFDLRDSLPHIFLKVMAAKTDDPDRLIGLLSKPLSTVEKKPAEKKATDFTTYQVKFAFSNLKKYYNDKRFMHPNTRLEFLTTTLKIDQKEPIKFYSIDRLQNEYDDIDLGTLSRDQAVSLNAKLSATGGLGSTLGTSNTGTTANSDNDQSGRTKSVYDANGNVIGTLTKTGTFTSSNQNVNGTTASANANLSATAEADYQNQQTIKEAIAVKLQRLKTGFNFSDKALAIAQRGRPLGDISDNIYVTAILKVTDPTTVFSLNVYTIDKLYDENNQPGVADKLVVSKRNISFVPCDKCNDIQLTTAYEGAVRAAGNKTSRDGTNALEYDDEITYYKIPPTDGDQLKIDKNVYCKNAYKYTANDAEGNTYVLKISAPTDEELDIFTDDAPEYFLQWLNNHVSNPEAAKLVTKRYKLYFESPATHKKIYIAKDRLSAAELAEIKTITGVKAEKRLP